MRACKLWVSPWTERAKVYVLDTSTLPSNGAWPVQLLRHQGRDEFPLDAVLAIVHPGDYQAFKSMIKERYSFVPSEMWTDEAIAAHLIEDCIAKDQTLKEKLKWT